MAGSLLGVGPNSSHNQSGGSSSGTSGIAGALIGSLLGGKKPDQQQPPQNHQQSQGGLIGSLGSMFGGHSQQGSSVSYTLKERKYHTDFEVAGE